MSRQFPSLYILYVLLSVFYVSSKSSPDPLESQSSVAASIRSANGTNDIDLRCFTYASGRSPLRYSDCQIALMQLVLTPGFNVVYKFSKNKRRLDTIFVPKGWGQDACVIMLSCANDQDAASFRLSEVAHQARAIIKQCVEGHDTSYGGIVGVSDVPSFYVSVAGAVMNPLQGSSTAIDDTELGGNTTLLDTE